MRSTLQKRSKLKDGARMSKNRAATRLLPGSSCGEDFPSADL